MYNLYKIYGLWFSFCTVFHHKVSSSKTEQILPPYFSSSLHGDYHLPMIKYTAVPGAGKEEEMQEEENL